MFAKPSGSAFAVLFPNISIGSLCLLGYFGTGPLLFSVLNLPNICISLSRICISGAAGGNLLSSLLPLEKVPRCILGNWSQSYGAGVALHKKQLQTKGSWERELRGRSELEMLQG